MLLPGKLRQARQTRELSYASSSHAQRIVIELNHTGNTPLSSTPEQNTSHLVRIVIGTAD